MILVPAVRAGPWFAAVTMARAAFAPARSAPSSVADCVAIGFFFAAMIPISAGNLGSGNASVMEATAGSGVETVAVPKSDTRTPLTVVPSLWIDDRFVAWGRPRA